MHAAASLNTILGSIGWSDMFVMDLPPLEKVLRTILVYLALAFILRFAGKRLMNQMNSLDLVVVLLISNVVQNAIIGDDNTVSGGIIGAITLVALNAILERLSQISPATQWLLEGTPTTLVKNGEPDTKALRSLGISNQELTTALRTQGADSATEVAEANITPGGTITVHLKPEEQPLSRGEFFTAIEQLRAELQRH